MSEMDDLAAFAVLIEAGSFTLAAQQLGCSKGQLSKRISQLEARFSVVLLQRTTRRLSLTAAGAALLPQAQALVVQVEKARQALARLKDDMAGADDGSCFAGGNLFRWLAAGVLAAVSRGADRTGVE